MSSQEIESVTVIKAADGHEKTVTQRLSLSGNGWSVESNLGKGGGTCYGDACENYIVNADGLAYATTIMIDGPKNRREITFELQNGKPVRVFREKLKRIN